MRLNNGVVRHAIGGLFLIISFSLVTRQAQSQPAADVDVPLVLEKTIPLADVSGRIDHMALDVRRKRLIVAELGNNSVDVLDIGAGKAEFRLTGLNEPQGVAYIASKDTILVSNGGSGDARVFKAEDGSPVASIMLGDDADNVRLAPETDAVFIGYGSGGLAALDTGKLAKIKDIQLPAHPEAFEISRDRQVVFVNVPEAGQIEVVDLKTNKIRTSWKTGELRSNFPMALNAKGTTLAVSFRQPPRLQLLDAMTGHSKQVLGTCEDADDVFFDEGRERIYVSCGRGSVDVFQRKDGDYQSIARIATASGARTSLFVPELDRLFVAAPGRLLTGARILVYKAAPGR